MWKSACVGVYQLLRINVCLPSRCRCQILTASFACFRNNVSSTTRGGGSMFLKVYSLTILLLDILSLIVKVIFAVIESLYNTVVGVTEKSVSNEIVLVSDCPFWHNVSCNIRWETSWLHRASIISWLHRASIISIIFNTLISNWCTQR